MQSICNCVVVGACDDMGSVLLAGAALEIGCEVIGAEDAGAKVVAGWVVAICSVEVGAMLVGGGQFCVLHATV